MLVKNINTVQTVYVHGPPPSPILQQNNTQSQMQNSFTNQRPVSAPKISINYSNNQLNSNILAQNYVKPTNHLVTTSVVNQPRIELLQRP